MTPREKAIIELVRLSEEEQRGADFIAQEEAATGKPKKQNFSKIYDKGRRIPCDHNVLHARYGRDYAAFGQCAAVRHNTVGTRITVFAVSRYRNDES